MNFFSLFIKLFVFFSLFSCKEKQKNYKNLLSKYVPESITITKKSGITIKDKFNSKGKVLKKTPLAILGYSFQVINAKPLYYKIQYTKNKVGWISAGIARGWTKLEDGKVKISLRGGITVRDFPYKKKIGVAANAFSFKILDVIFSYYQVSLPEGGKGWIYAGKIKDRWVDDKDSVEEKMEEENTEEEKRKKKKRILKKIIL